MVVGFIIVAVIPLVIICTLLVQSFKVIFSEEQKREAEEIQVAVNKSVITLFDSLEETALNIEKNSNISKYMDPIGTWEHNQGYNALYKETNGIRDLVQIDLYNEQGICMYTTGNNPIESKIPLNRGIIKKASNNPTEISYLEYKKYGNDGIDEAFLLGAKPIVVMDEVKGYILFEIKDDNFSYLFQGIYNSRNRIAVLSQYWDEIYISEEIENENIVEEIRRRLLDDDKVEMNIAGFIPNISKIPNTDIFILFLQPKILSENNLSLMYQTIIAFAALSLLLSLFAANHLSKNLMEPIKQLSSAMYEMESGNLDIEITNFRKDEFGALFQDFNQMTLKIKAFTEQRIQNEKELNASHIAMMHAQLNPHFLYNTLDTIKWSGKMHNSPEICTMATSLAKILRISISEEKVIFLEEELALIESYMKIQQIRFDDCFTYNVELPNELKKLMIPKLIIQPIVENALLHGLSDSKGGYIIVKCLVVNEVLNVEVLDNGCGIKEDILDSLNTKGENQLVNHIGFYNVNKIIRLTYGDEYGLYAERIKTGGTKVVLRMPVIMGE
jgi:two-component system sensor histidine kinase YesM